MNLTHKYLRTFLLGFQAAIEYRANFILSILTTFLQIIVQLYLWSALFSNSTDDRIYNFTKEQMMFYVLFAALVSRFIRTGFEYEVVSDIKNGGIDKFFVRPVGYIMYRLSAFLGKTMSFTIPMLVIMGGCLFFLSHIFLQNTL
ncbi:MAG: hypothetical protein K0Q87_4459, partial [Neobacillus sp.]|nr:hypothetical protein [Neobacillus sp.]